MNAAIEFQAHQILCWEHQETYLYVEVIQTVPQRAMTWVRPLALVGCLPENSGANLNAGSLDKQQDRAETPTLYDLRQGADLLCPSALLRIALDVEVIPVLTQLDALKPASEGERTSEREENIPARHHLEAFIRRVWQAHPEAFQL